MPAANPQSGMDEHVSTMTACAYMLAGREAQRFHDLLAAEGLPVMSRKYFAGEPLSLEMHFEVIEAMQVESSDIS
jgi:hypothetical protein